MRPTVLITILLALPGTVWSQTASGDAATTHEAILTFAGQAVPRALRFSQGDRASLLDAEGDFTPKGWKAFRQSLTGWLDDEGAPTYTSSFTRGEKPPRIRSVDGGFLVTIYGELKQQHRNEHGGVSTTTYRVAVDATISTKPLKVDLLEERTCGKTPCD